MPINESSTPRDEVATEVLKASEFFIHTSPEMEALERAAADGVHDRNYQNGRDGYGELLRYHQIPNSSHRVEVQLTPTERALGGDEKTLESLTGTQDADGALAFLYISRLLAPPSPLDPNTAPAGKIDLDDVIEKIGWDPRTSEERRQLRRQLFQFIVFGERAKVIGTRSGIYKDRQTNEVINTRVESAIWRVMRTETPERDSPNFDSDVPVVVELVIGREWSQLLSQPQTAQYLPMGELLGAIPGSKPSGAWARVIGLALASFWRRNPHESMNGSLRPTRRELLERYPPKTGTVHEVLAWQNNTRAIAYWCAALKTLAKAGFIEREGEALLTPQEIRSGLPPRNWMNEWLNAKVELHPGPALKGTIMTRATAAEKKPKRRTFRKKAG